MESQIKLKTCRRRARALRLRKRVRGESTKPRLSVIKSNAHIHLQLIDDTSSSTLASASTLSKEFKASDQKGKNMASAKALGLKLAELARAKNIKEIVFDRGPFKYHGVVAAVADGAREGGLEF